MEAVKRGLGIDSKNVDLKKMGKELDEASRISRVSSAISTAETQMKSKDIHGAMKTIDGAMRLDPTNETLKRMMSQVQPLVEKAEKTRMAGLDSKERLKEEGDKKFKAADFESAIKAYTKCLDAISDKVRLISGLT
jgi:hypothetical protein